MMTSYLIAVSIGALAGTALGFKLGRGYERVRPRRKRPGRKD